VNEDRLLAASRGDLNGTPGVSTAAGSVSAPLAPAKSAVDAGAASAPGTTSAVGGTTAGGAATRSASSAPATSGSGGAKTTPGAKTTAAVGAGAPCSGVRSTLVIGAVGEQTGLVGATLGGGPKAVQAWVQRTNAKGGLDCHPLKYIVADDGGDPAKHASLVQQLVETDGVKAFVQMNAALAGQSAIKYLEKKGVPVIGGDGASSWFYDSPVYYPQGVHGADFVGASIVAIAQGAKAKGMTKVGTIACIEATICSIVTQVFDEYIKRVPEVSDVYKGSASLTAPDFTAQCLRAKDAGAQALVLALDYTGIQRVARSCGSVGYHPLLGTVSQAAQPEVASDPNLDGLIAAMNTAPWFDAGNAEMDEQIKTMNQYGVKLDGSTSQGWVAALLFTAAMQNVPSEPTSKDILDGLNHIKNNDLGGTTGLLTFHAGENHKAPFCYFPVGVTKGAFVSLNGFKRVCQ
jgi:branched-chain amino acid transport system substrate-binding protein